MGRSRFTTTTCTLKRYRRSSARTLRISATCERCSREVWCSRRRSSNTSVASSLGCTVIRRSIPSRSGARFRILRVQPARPARSREKRSARRSSLIWRKRSRQPSHSLYLTFFSVVFPRDHVRAGSHLHPRGQGAQPQEHLLRHSEEEAGRLHRRVRVGEELARL